MTKPQFALLLIPFTLTASLLLAAAPPTTATSQPQSKTAEVYTQWPFDAKEAVKRQDDTAKDLGIPKTTTVNLGGEGGVPMKFILIPAGKYEDENKKEL